MKRIAIIIIVIVSINFVSAQTYNVKIKQGTGTTYSVSSSIDEITFLNTATTPFTCGDVVLYGGETYPTVQIGSQCWFAKNLNIGTRINGATNQTDNGIIERYCYNDLPANCITYGGLYLWNEALDYKTKYDTKGICPVGWHIPTEADFTSLQNSISNNANALKAIGEGTGSGIGTNTSGFSAMLGGYRQSNAYYSGITQYTYFLLSTPDYVWDNTLAKELSYNYSFIQLVDCGTLSGMSIRCIKD